MFAVDTIGYVLKRFLRSKVLKGVIEVVLLMNEWG